MLRRIALIALPCVAALAALGSGIADSAAQRDVALLKPDEAQAQLERATRESQRAQARATRLRREADAATEAADKAAREAAALAAQIQQAEAQIEAARARYSLARTDRAQLSARLAERQQPLVRLTGALQTTARRPLALSALKPGSLKDVVYVRAVLDSAVPVIRARTATLRSEVEEGRRLEQQAERALATLRETEGELQAQRQALAQWETRQRLLSREARSGANRESERALALAEEARDLDGLIGELDAAASLRRELAALPGPILRPGTGGEAAASPRAPAPSPTAVVAQASSARPPLDFQLPVQGRTVAGFGVQRDSGLRSAGITLAPSPGAQVVAPATGRIAFAGLYRGYGRIVIIEHEGGWTTLVTGLARVSVEVGDSVIGGSPLGVATSSDAIITLELRQSGEAVNPLQFLT